MEVWGAVLASTLTTVAVFLPIVFVQEEAGQLFRDIAIAISSAVVLSLVISITGIPSLSAKILGKVKRRKSRRIRILSATGLAQGFVNLIVRFVNWMCAYVTVRLLVIIVLISTASGLALFLMPKTEYLPEGNREMLFGILLPPPGYNLGELEEIAEKVEKDVLPLIEHEGEVNEFAQKNKLPPIKNFFYVAWGQQVFMGVISKVQERTRSCSPISTAL